MVASEREGRTARRSRRGASVASTPAPGIRRWRGTCARGLGSARWGDVGRRRWVSSPPRRRRPYRNSRQPRSRQPRRGAFSRSRTRAMRRAGGRASAPRSRPPATRTSRQPRSHPRASSIPTARRPGAYRGLPPRPRLGSSQKGRTSSRRPRWSPRCAAGARTRARRFFP